MLDTIVVLFGIRAISQLASVSYAISIYLLHITSIRHLYLWHLDTFENRERFFSLPRVCLSTR